jgi:outer membrane protein assembly factor BamA
MPLPFTPIIITDESSVQVIPNLSQPLAVTASNRRSALFNSNLYNNADNNNNYSSTHPNAQADGDAKGRGDINGFVGTSIDVTRKNLLLYNSPNHPYFPNSGYFGYNFPEQYW